MHHWPAWGRERVLELLGHGPRRLPLHQRRDAAAGQPRPDAERDRRAGRVPARARPPLGDARLLRLAQPQRQGDLRQLPRLVRRQPGRRSTRMPPEEAAKRYVEFMGGADAALDKARGAFELGDYRWVAEVVNHVVFADPDNQAARDLQADALEQLGYQAESGPWRNFYLTAAQELRDGVAAAADAEHRQPRHGARDEHRAVLRLPRACGSTARKAGDRAITLGAHAPRRRRDLDADGPQRRAQPPRSGAADDARRARHASTAPTSTTSSSASPRSPIRSPTAAPRSTATSRRCTTSSRCSTTSSSGSTS